MLQVGDIQYFICGNCQEKIPPVWETRVDGTQRQVPSSNYWKQGWSGVYNTDTGKRLSKGTMVIVEPYCSAECSLARYNT